MAKVGRSLDRLVAYLGYLGMALGMLSVVAMMAIIVLNIITRYFFDKSLLFVNEYAAYFLIVVVYMGFAHSMRIGAHINMDLVVKRFSERARDGLDAVTSLIALGVTGVYFWYVWKLFMESLQRGELAQQLTKTPLWVPQMFLWVGLLFLGLELIARIVKKSVAFQRGAKRKSAAEDILGVTASNEPEGQT